MKKNEPKKVQPKATKSPNQEGVIERKSAYVKELETELEASKENSFRYQKAAARAGAELLELRAVTTARYEALEKETGKLLDANGAMVEELTILRARLLAEEMADDAALAAEDDEIPFGAPEPAPAPEVVYHRGPQGPEAFCVDPSHPRMGWRHERGGPEYCVKCGWVVPPA